MTFRVALTGTDGSGKTTIVRRLSERYAVQPLALRAFRAPQYHEDPDLPFGQLSSAIDELGMLADRRGDHRLKATALFLSMTLYGDVERHVARTYAPAILVAERQCLADSLTYSRFYLPLLTGNLDERSLEGPIAGALTPAGWAAIQSWLPVFQARVAGRVAPAPFFGLPRFIRDIFESPADAMLDSLMAVYAASIPDAIIHLTVPPEQIVGRLASKRGMPGGAAIPPELHEHAHVLAAFQEGLVASCVSLRHRRPDLRITTIDTGDRTIAETEASVLSALGVEI